MNEDRDVRPIPIDWRAYADDARHAKRDTFTCQGCGNDDPARLNADCTRCERCEVVIESTDGYVVTADLERVS